MQHNTKNQPRLDLKIFNNTDFEYPLNEYMEEAYKGFAKKNKVDVNRAAAKIDLESKLAMKDGLLSEKERNDLRKYFWDLCVMLKF